MQQFSTSLIPTLPLLSLSEDERRMILACQAEGWRHRTEYELSRAFYLGTQVLTNLRIAIPKELEFINPVIGWGAKAVDPYVERLNADSFRLAGATDSDSDLDAVMAENGFRSEQSLAFRDAISMGPALWCVGSPLESGGVPRVTVESPLNMSVLWDLRGINARASMQEYWQDGRKHGVFMVKGKTITLATDDNGQWVVADRDEHGFDFVPVIRMANLTETVNRGGRSEISHALRYLIAATCRTLLGLEVSRELYSVPQKAILGASEADFVKSDGTPKTAFETYINMVLALERDADGQLPELKQLQPYDPSVFTKLLDWYASAAAGEVKATPQDMGLYTQGNPATSDAVKAGEARRNGRAKSMQRGFELPLVRMAQTVVRFQNKGDLPKEYRGMSVDWSPIVDDDFSVTADGVSKLVKQGVLPATSDVTLKRAGFSAVERRRLEQDRKSESGANAAKAIVDALAGQTQATPEPGNAATVAG